MADKDDQEYTKRVYRSQDREHKRRVITSFAMMVGGIILIIVLMYLRKHRPG